MEDSAGSASLHQRFGAHVPSGRVVVQQGEPGGHLYVLVKGDADLSVHKSDAPDSVVRKLGPGELFGVTSCFTGLPHTATMRVVSDSFVLRFDRDTVEHLIRAQPPFAVAVIEALVERLRSATARHVLTEREDGEQEGAQEPGDRRKAN